MSNNWLKLTPDASTTKITGTATSTTMGFNSSGERIPRTSFDVSNAQSAVIAATIDVATPSAGTSAAANWDTSDVITVTSHGFYTGLVGQVTTSGALPTGISGSTNYYVRWLSANTFSLYDTYAHAIDIGSTTGIVNITNVGSGNHTFTPTAIAGCTVALEGSLDNGATYVTVPNSSRTVTADATEVWEIDYIRYTNLRFLPTLTSGLITIASQVLIKL